IQIMSDLHLEFHFRTPPRGSAQGYHVFSPPVCAPNLALLGDIGLVAHEGLFIFLEAQLRRFKRVFYLLGNHEFYGRGATYDETVRKFEAFAQRVLAQEALGEFVFLNRGRYDVPDEDVTVLGCTLWSHVPPESVKAVQSGLNDFKEILDWSIEQHVDAHAQDVSWLSAQLVNPDLKNIRVVVLTHHAPTLNGTSDRKHAGSAVAAGYATELSSRKDLWGADSPVKVWAFGHTHHCCDFELDGVRVYSNQRGY
ncbi:calcineurin-like phosphoesterase, partial [Exidia glandulosa HHB12029]